MKPKIIKISTIPIFLNTFCRGQLEILSKYFKVIAVSSPGSELEELGKREGGKRLQCRWKGI